MTKDAVIQFMRGRLLVDRSEFRWIPGRHILNVGWIARAVNVGELEAETVTLMPDDVERAAAPAHRYDINVRCGGLAPWFLDVPLLAYRRAHDGALVLIDGRQRAAQAFATGRSGVTARVVAEADARRAGQLSQTRLSYKILEASGSRPLFASDEGTQLSIDPMERVVVDLHGKRVDGRGRKPLPDYADDLRAMIYLASLELVWEETYIRRRFRRAALVEIDSRASPSKGVDQLTYEALRVKLGLGSRFPTTWDNICSKAPNIVRQVTKTSGTDEYRAYHEEAMAKRDKAEALYSRELLIKTYVFLMKAYAQMVEREKIITSLFHDENSSRTVDAEFIDKIKRKSSKKISSDLALDWNEQVTLAASGGINPTLMYPEYTRHDSAFEALAWVLWFRRGDLRPPSPAMIETVLQRRAVALSGEKDQDSYL